MADDKKIISQDTQVPTDSTFEPLETISARDLADGTAQVQKDLAEIKFKQQKIGELQEQIREVRQEGKKSQTASNLSGGLWGLTGMLGPLGLALGQFARTGLKDAEQASKDKRIKELEDQIKEIRIAREEKRMSKESKVSSETPTSVREESVADLAGVGEASDLKEKQDALEPVEELKRSNKEELEDIEDHAERLADESEQARKDAENDLGVLGLIIMGLTAVGLGWLVSRSGGGDEDASKIPQSEADVASEINTLISEDSSLEKEGLGAVDAELSTLDISDMPTEEAEKDPVDETITPSGGSGTQSHINKGLDDQDNFKLRGLAPLGGMSKTNIYNKYGYDPSLEVLNIYNTSDNSTLNYTPVSTSDQLNLSHDVDKFILTSPSVNLETIDKPVEEVIQAETKKKVLTKEGDATSNTYINNKSVSNTSSVTPRTKSPDSYNKMIGK